MTTPVPPEARAAAHDATALPLAQAMITSPHDLIDIALDAAAPLIVADFARRLLARTAGTILGDDLANVLEDLDGDPAPPVVHWLTGKVTAACGSGGTGASALVNTGLNSTIRGDVTCEACKQTTAWRTHG